MAAVITTDGRLRVSQMQKTAIGSSAKLLARLAAGSTATSASLKRVARRIAKQRSEAGMFGYTDLPQQLQKPHMADADAVRRLFVPGEADRYRSRITQIRDRMAKKLDGVSALDLWVSRDANALSNRLAELLRKTEKKPAVISRAWWAARRRLGLRPSLNLDLLRHIKDIPENLPEVAANSDTHRNLADTRRVLQSARITGLLNPNAFSGDELQMLQRAAAITRRAGLRGRQIDRLDKWYSRLYRVTVEPYKYQRPPAFINAHGPIPVEVTPTTRLKAFNLSSMRDVPEGDPLWYTPHPDVVRGYATGRSGGRGGSDGGRQAIALTDEGTLRQFGDVGPLQPHIGEDTRGLLRPPKQPVIGRNTSLGERPDYEQVATMPNLTEWIKSHRFIAPDRHNPTRLKVYPPRALGKDFS